MQTENTENLRQEDEDTHIAEEAIGHIEYNKEDGVEDEQSAEEKLKLELAEMKDKYIRMYSEFENFRRRTAKEKIDLIHNASQDVVKELLPVVDDFERAQAAMQNATEVEPVKEGVALVFNKLNGILTRQGVKPMESKDAAFDVELHECITQIDAGDENKGKVVDVIEKGYYLNDKVLRYAKVVVGK